MSKWSQMPPTDVPGLKVYGSVTLPLTLYSLQVLVGTNIIYWLLQGLCKILKRLGLSHKILHLVYTNLLFFWMYNRQNWLRFVYTHFKSCDQSLDEISFDSMQSCAMCAKSRTIRKLPKGMVT